MCIVLKRAGQNNLTLADKILELILKAPDETNSAVFSKIRYLEQFSRYCRLRFTKNFQKIRFLCRTIFYYIQGVPQVSANTYRGGRGGQGEQKIICEGGGAKMQPWGVMGKIIFLDLLKKKILSKSGLHFRANVCMAVLQAISFPMVCLTCRFKVFFVEFQSIEVKIYCFLSFFLTLAAIFV